jgi:arylsulfatase A-like enzyme
MLPLLLASLILTADEPAGENRRPNVLFCFADDWGRYASAYGKLDDRPSPAGVIRTPNIDAVAGRGALFRNAFVPAPSCTPCRSSLLSGRYFFNTGRGAILNGAVWDDRIPAYPLLLEGAGYQIAKTGKVWSPGTPADAPFGAQKFAVQGGGMRFMNFSEQMTRMLAGGSNVETARAELVAEVRRNFESFLRKRKQGQPFHYWFGPTNVHRTWVKGSGKALWGIEPETLKGRLPAFLPDVPEVREDFADYLGEGQAFDAFIGALVEALREAGELERTVIVISGDHGPPGFPRGKCNLHDFGSKVGLIAAGPGIRPGRVIDDLVSLMDLAPTFLELGGVAIPKGVAGRSLVPLLASEKSGWIDPTRDHVIIGRERHVADARAGNLPYPQRALRTREHLYIRNFEPDRWPMGDPKGLSVGAIPTREALTNDTFAAFADMDAGPTKAWLIAHRDDPAWRKHFDLAFGRRPAEELYELATDPDQVTNRAADPALAKVRSELADRLNRILTEAGDPRLVENPCRFERPPYTDPRERPAAPKAKKARKESEG